MASISTAGIGSGLDIRGIVDALVDAERAPTASRLDLKESTSQARISSFGNLKSSLSSLQSSLSSLRTVSNFEKRTASISNSDLFGAAISSLASPGSYTVKVNTLAQSHTLASDAASPFETTADAIGTGTLNIEFGTFSGGIFTADPDKASGSVVIGSSDNSVEGIREAINNADIGVTASIVNDGSGFRLLISSDESGESNSLKITVSGDSLGSDIDTSGLSQLAYDPAAAVGSGKNLTETLAATDASVDINGLNVTSNNNTISGAITGVTLNLLETSATATTLTVTNDVSSVTNSINNFVTQYNSYISLLDSVAGYNADTGTGGILQGDSVVRSIDAQVRNLIGRTFGNGSVQSLSEIGITSTSDGTLSVDGSKLSSALASDFSSVGRIFAATGTPTDPLVAYIGSTSVTRDGNYAVEIDSLATQGTFEGDATVITNITLTSANNIFTLTVDGVATNTITLSEGTYDDDTKLAALANEIQTKINNDTNLKAQGITVSATYDATNDRFQISSSRYGSSSNVAINAENATLGFTSSGTSTDGADIAGTIGGVAATGNGQLLTGTGTAEGLGIVITGGATGLRGSVNFSRGIADRLDTLISNFLDTDGVLEARLDGLDASIDDINEQRVALGTRLAALEIRLLRQFTALDVLVANLQSTGSFLSQQLDNLPQIGGNR